MSPAGRSIDCMKNQFFSLAYSSAAAPVMRARNLKQQDAELVKRNDQYAG